MKLGTNDIGSVYLGTSAVQKVYLGTNEVWSSYAYLLDDYTGAAAAYSLRLLRSAYTGSAIRVRIATTGNPEYNIGFVNNQLDVATLEGYCTGGLNAFVKTWYDQSGNGYDAEQTTLANQPQIVSGGSVILENSKPSVQFDGSDDNFTLTRLTDLQMSIGVATKTSSGKFTLTRDGNTSDSRGWFMRESPSVWNMQQIGTSPRISSYTISSNNQYLMTISANGTNSQYSLNGNVDSQESETDKIIVSEIGRYHISTFSFQGNTQELIFYPSDQSSNRTGIETNINSFYSIY